MRNVFFIGAVATTGLLGWIVAGSPSATAAEPTATNEVDAVREARQHYAGTWRVVAIEVDGKRLPDDGRPIVVTNAVDGSWTITVDGKESSRGTSRIAPLAHPAEIDIDITTGDGRGGKWRGIYEMGDKTRRLCFSGGDADRPGAFVTAPESNAVLVTFERQ
jgi:uncharacterized protein (TIGR03067 family)